MKNHPTVVLILFYNLQNNMLSCIQQHSYWYKSVIWLVCKRDDYYPVVLFWLSTLLEWQSYKVDIPYNHAFQNKEFSLLWAYSNFKLSVFLYGTWKPSSHTILSFQQYHFQYHGCLYAPYYSDLSFVYSEWLT
jgi:hypothetical protein